MKRFVLVLEDENENEHDDEDEKAFMESDTDQREFLNPCRGLVS